MQSRALTAGKHLERIRADEGFHPVAFVYPAQRGPAYSTGLGAADWPGRLHLLSEDSSRPPSSAAPFLKGLKRFYSCGTMSREGRVKLMCGGRRLALIMDRVLLSSTVRLLLTWCCYDEAGPAAEPQNKRRSLPHPPPPLSKHKSNYQINLSSAQSHCMLMTLGKSLTPLCFLDSADWQH